MPKLKNRLTFGDVAQALGCTTAEVRAVVVEEKRRAAPTAHCPVRPEPIEPGMLKRLIKNTAAFAAPGLADI